MISKKMEAAFNAQIAEELFSAGLYYQMAGWFSANGYDGMAGWMLVQKGEEQTHAHKFFEHIAQRGGMPVIGAMQAPKAEWKNPLEIFQAAVKHEQHITACINKLLDLAHAEKDHAAAEFLQWFVKEQVEEEDSVSKAAQKLERIGSSGAGLVMMDKELGKRGKA